MTTEPTVTVTLTGSSASILKSLEAVKQAFQTGAWTTEPTTSAPTATRGRPAKAAKPETTEDDEDFNLDEETTETSSDDMPEVEEDEELEDEDEESGDDFEKVEMAFKNFVAKHAKKTDVKTARLKAKKVLAKFSATSIQALKPKQYKEVMKALGL